MTMTKLIQVYQAHFEDPRFYQSTIPTCVGYVETGAILKIEVFDAFATNVSRWINGGGMLSIAEHFSIICEGESKNCQSS